jgi:hypothetical protein
VLLDNGKNMVIDKLTNGGANEKLILTEEYINAEIINTLKFLHGESRRPARLIKFDKAGGAEKMEKSLPIGRQACLLVGKPCSINTTQR